jgi:hypothetical protein
VARRRDPQDPPPAWPAHRGTGRPKGT